MATDPNELIEQAKCFNCKIPRGMLLPVLIYMLDNAINGNGENMSTDPNVLMQQATCYDCKIPVGMQMSVLVSQINSIINSGMYNSDRAQTFVKNYGGVAPTDVPLTTLAIAVDTSNHEVWIFFSGSWHDTGMATA